MHNDLRGNDLKRTPAAHALPFEKRACRYSRDGYRTAAKNGLTRSDMDQDVAHKDVSNLREDVMLVLSRKVGESIVIDGDIVISVSSVQGGRVKLCIDAPRDKRISRGELEESAMPSILCDSRTLSDRTVSERTASKPVLQLAGM
jgi:carbon storage regulator